MRQYFFLYLKIEPEFLKSAGFSSSIRKCCLLFIEARAILVLHKCDDGYVTSISVNHRIFKDQKNLSKFRVRTRLLTIFMIINCIIQVEINTLA